MAAPVPIRPLVADRQSIRDGHAERRGSTLTDIRHEGVRKISRKTRSPSEPPTASMDLINSAVLLNCRWSTLRAPRHNSPDYSHASRRAPPWSSFHHAKTFSRTNFAQHKHSACVCVWHYRFLLHTQVIVFLYSSQMVCTPCYNSFPPIISPCFYIF
jgi:hypothetical protein